MSGRLRGVRLGTETTFAKSNRPTARASERKRVQGRVHGKLKRRSTYLADGVVLQLDAGLQESKEFGEHLVLVVTPAQVIEERQRGQ